MKSKKIKRISLRNTILNFFNLTALGFILVIGLTFLFQIILPLINNVQEGQKSFQELNNFIKDIQTQNPQDLAKFFALKDGDTLDPSLIGPVQVAFNTMQIELEKIINQLNDPENTDYLALFNTSISGFETVINSFLTSSGNKIILTPTALDRIKTLENAQKIINDVNNIGTEWFNISFNMVFQDIKNNTFDVKRYVDTIVQSKIAFWLFGLIAALLFFLFFTFFFIFSAWRAKKKNRRLKPELQVANGLMNLNLFLSFFIVFGWITWFAIWRQSRRKYKRDQAKIDFSQTFETTGINTFANVRAKEGLKITPYQAGGTESLHETALATEEKRKKDKKNKKNAKAKNDDEDGLSFTNLYR